MAREDAGAPAAAVAVRPPAPRHGTDPAAARQARRGATASGRARARRHAALKNPRHPRGRARARRRRLRAGRSRAQPATRHRLARRGRAAGSAGAAAGRRQAGGEQGGEIGGIEPGEHADLAGRHRVDERGHGRRVDPAEDRGDRIEHRPIQLQRLQTSERQPAYVDDVVNPAVRPNAGRERKSRRSPTSESPSRRPQTWQACVSRNADPGTPASRRSSTLARLDVAERRHPRPPRRRRPGWTKRPLSVMLPEIGRPSKRGGAVRNSGPRAFSPARSTGCPGPRRRRWSRSAGSSHRRAAGGRRGLRRSRRARGSLPTPSSRPRGR